LNKEWSFPLKTHSLDALLYDQWITGSYWDEHEVSKRQRPAIRNSLVARVARLRTDSFLVPPSGKRYRTVRDALLHLPDPQDPSVTVANHEYRPGARSYSGHTGSVLDEPSKVLKAGDHGVPGGENTLVMPNGKVRYFTVRESARIQAFPDEYIFSGSWTEAMRQIGNAVPVTLASAVGRSIRKQVL
jgi:DNA (cytosine-5)-methyltransferase 1